MEAWIIFVGILILLMLFFAIMLILLVYSGLCKRIEVGAGSPPIGQVVIAYKFARGPYKEVGPLFSQVSKIAPGNKCLGIYYDDPHKVEARRLRHVVGSVLAEGGEAVDMEQVKKFEAEGFHIFHLPHVENVVRTSFPFLTTLSIFIAVQKVYPKMHRYVKDHSLCAHPYLEVYEGKTMHFMAPLSRQDDFYVPEALQHFEGEEPYESFYSDESTQDFSHSDVSFSTEASQAELSGLESSQAQEEGDSTVPEGDSIVREEDGTVREVSAAGAREEKETDEESTSSFEELRMEGGNVQGSGSQ